MAGASDQIFHIFLFYLRGCQSSDSNRLFSVILAGCAMPSYASYAFCTFASFCASASSI